MIKSKSAAILAAAGMLTTVFAAGFREAPATASASSRILVVSADTVSATEGCISTSEYPRGTMIVFRAQVHTQSGALAAPTDKVVAHLSNGVTIPMMDIHHPLPGKPMYWVGTWVVPMNEKLGVISYTVTAVNPKTGVHGTYHPFPAPTSLPTIVPFTYSTTVSATVSGSPAELVKAGDTVAISAAVDQPAEVKGKIVMEPLTKGTIMAEFGVSGDVTKTGALKASISVPMTYQASSKTWVTSVPVPAVVPAGMYEIEVLGHDANGNVVQSSPVYIGVEG
jgi:hypothetical protein